MKPGRELDALEEKYFGKDNVGFFQTAIVNIHVLRKLLDIAKVGLNWRDPKVERPKVGQVIWVLTRHWKHEPGQSCEVFCGEYEVPQSNPDIYPARCLNLDYIGQGSASWDFPLNEEDYGDCNFVQAWLPLEELNEPKWFLGAKQ